MIFATTILGEPMIVQLVRHSGMARKRRPLVVAIARVTAGYFNLSPDIMKGGCREKNIVRARQIAMYLARELTEQSLAELGRFFGNRHHTTVLHSIRVVEDRICKSVEVAEDVEAIRERLVA